LQEHGKAKAFLPFLQRAGRTVALVEVRNAVGTWKNMPSRVNERDLTKNKPRADPRASFFKLLSYFNLPDYRLIQ
jgi:hypothetical protein